MPRRSSSRSKGTEYEQKAAVYMMQHNMLVLEQNYRCRQGEVDIVGQENGYLLFVEVKYRKNTGAGYPSEAVTPSKQAKIKETARYYLYSHDMPETTKVRFDVAAILGEDIRYIKDAFS